MKKMTLNLDALVVDSFTTGRGEGTGTVKGHDSTTDCGQTDSGFAYCADGGSGYGCTYTCNTIEPHDTCQDTCSHTCDGPTCGYLDPACASFWGGCPHTYVANDCTDIGC